MTQRYYNVSLEGEDGRLVEKRTVREDELVSSIREMAGNAEATFSLDTGVGPDGEYPEA